MQRWINVKERLPDDDCFVLAVVSGRFQNVTFVRTQVIAEYGSELGWIIDGYEKWENPPITHWMPLPEAPGGEEDE